MITIFSPAKVNLGLKIIGKYDDGFHKIRSLLYFTDIGDYLTLSCNKYSPDSSTTSTASTTSVASRGNRINRGNNDPEKNNNHNYHHNYEEFTLKITGEFAKNLQNEGITASIRGLCQNYKENFIYYAYVDFKDYLLKNHRNIQPNTLQNIGANIHIELVKNLPLASGLGGGSSNYIASLQILMQYFDVKIPLPDLHQMAKKRGSDIPSFLYGKPLLAYNKGDDVRPVPSFNRKLPIIIINPKIQLPTAEIYKKFTADNPNKQGSETDRVSRRVVDIVADDKLNDKAYGRADGSNHHKNIGSQYSKYSKDMFSSFAKFKASLRFLQNDLQKPAQASCPAISQILTAFNAPDSSSGNAKDYGDYGGDILFAGLSGSGASCFAIYETEEVAKSKAMELQRKLPNYWLKRGNIFV